MRPLDDPPSESADVDSVRTRLEDLVERERPRRIVVVTGAGISVASGIPTYRGEDGYWTETSANYRPESTGYLSTFRASPREVWAHSLTHRRTCLAAAPNAGHRALADLERCFGDDFLLVTQNVDGLHLDAGNSPARTIEAHGNVHTMRPLDPRPGDPMLLPIPEAVVCPERGEPLDDESWALLRMADGRLARPHAMFFDEPYDEGLYRSQEACDAARACDLIIVIGTSGSTAMPWYLAMHARDADAAIICVDPDDTPFGSHARNRERVGKGLWIRSTSEPWVPEIVQLLERVAKAPPKPAPTSSAVEPEQPPLEPVQLEPVAGPAGPERAVSVALAELLGRRPPRRVVVCTGAGISAESGLRTFRGPGGYWVVGGRRPLRRDELEADLRGGWAFMLQRREAYRAAEPNAAHLALARLESVLGDELRLITQNIDGLHGRAGSSEARTIELHGNCDRMRAVEGDPRPIPIPEDLPALEPGAPLPDAIWERLVMPDGRRARPHILAWDEAYNEVQYRSESALAAARRCDLLVMIGTSGSAAMPYAIAAEAVLEADATLIDINVEDNAYAEHARVRAEEGKGLAVTGTAGRWVPELVTLLCRLREAR